jgi:hypothetical protein
MVSASDAGGKPEQFAAIPPKQRIRRMLTIHLLASGKYGRNKI